MPASAPPPGHPGLLSMGLSQAGAAQERKSEEAIVVIITSPLSSLAEACLAAPVPYRLPRCPPIFQLVGAGRSGRGYCIRALEEAVAPASPLQGSQSWPSPRPGAELQKQTNKKTDGARRDVPGDQSEDMSCTLLITRTNKVTLAGGFPSRRFSLPPHNPQRKLRPRASRRD